MNRLQDKIAFISGAAGSIGAATARRFVAEGARVVVSDLDRARLDALVEELGEDSAVAAVVDVTRSAATRRPTRSRSSSCSSPPIRALS